MYYRSGTGGRCCIGQQTILEIMTSNQKSDLSIDAYVIEEKPCQISSNLK